MGEQNSEVGRVSMASAPQTISGGDLPGRLQELKRDLASWALKYHGFRKRLLEDPKAVIEKELGVALPANLNVEVLEETDCTLFFVIPRKPFENSRSQDGDDDGLGVELRDVAHWVSSGRSMPVFEMPDSAQDPEIRLIARAWEDKAFRRRLLSDPEFAIREALGIALPEGVDLHAVEESSSELYIVLPAAIDDECEVEEEFPKEELATLRASMVAGTRFPTSFDPC